MSFYFQPPDLAEFPRRSYRRFLEEKIGQLFAEISPITSDYSRRFEISFLGPDGKVNWYFEDYLADSGYPTSAESARRTNMTFARRLLIDVWLRDTNTSELSKTTCYLADLPVITDRGSFVINGSERVVLGQLIRAPGIYYQQMGPLHYRALLLAEQGAPLTMELHVDPGVSKTSRAKLRIRLPRRSWITCTNLLIGMGVDMPTLDRRLGKLLHANRLELKEITE